MIDYLLLHARTIITVSTVVLVIFVIVWIIRAVQEFRLNRGDQIAVDLQITRIFIDIVKAAHGGDAMVQYTGQPDQVVAIQGIYELSRKHRRVRKLGIDALMALRGISAELEPGVKLPIEEYIRTLKKLW